MSERVVEMENDMGIVLFQVIFNLYLGPRPEGPSSVSLSAVYTQGFCFAARPCQRLRLRVSCVGSLFPSWPVGFFGPGARPIHKLCKLHEPHRALRVMFFRGRGLITCIPMLGVEYSKATNPSPLKP